MVMLGAALESRERPGAGSGVVDLEEPCTVASPSPDPSPKTKPPIENLGVPALICCCTALFLGDPQRRGSAVRKERMPRKGRRDQQQLVPLGDNQG